MDFLALRIQDMQTESTIGYFIISRSIFRQNPAGRNVCNCKSPQAIGGVIAKVLRFFTSLQIEGTDTKTF